MATTLIVLPQACRKLQLVVVVHESLAPTRYTARSVEVVPLQQEEALALLQEAQPGMEQVGFFGGGGGRGKAAYILRSPHGCSAAGCQRWQGRGAWAALAT